MRFDFIIMIDNIAKNIPVYPAFPPGGDFIGEHIEVRNFIGILYTVPANKRFCLTDWVVSFYSTTGGITWAGVYNTAPARKYYIGYWVPYSAEGYNDSLSLSPPYLLTTGESIWVSSSKIDLWMEFTIHGWQFDI